MTSARSPQSSGSSNYRAVSVGFSLLCASCGADKPSTSLAADALKAAIHGESAADVQVRNLEKRDGQSRETEGVREYALQFSAALQFSEDRYWVYSKSFEGTEFSVWPTVRGSCKPGWICAGGPELRFGEKGSHIKINGIVGFQKSERGWNAQAIDFVIDSTTIGPTVESLANRVTSKEVASSNNSPGAPDQALRTAETGRTASKNNGHDERRIDARTPLEFGEAWLTADLPPGGPDTMTLRVHVTAEHPNFWISAGSVPNAGVSVEAFRKELFKHAVSGAASVDQALVSLSLRSPSGAVVSESFEYDSHTYDNHGKEHTLKAGNLAPGDYALLVKRVRGTGRFSVRYFGGFVGD